MRYLILGLAGLVAISVSTSADAGCPRDIYALKAKLRSMRVGNISKNVQSLVAQAERQFKAGERKKCDDTIARAMEESEKRPVTRKPPTKKKRL